MSEPVDYETIGAEIGSLVNRKQRAYGDSFGKSAICLKQMYPDGIPVEQYGNLLAIARMLDKMFRVATDPTAFNENPWEDMAGYCILQKGKSQETTTQDDKDAPF
jgi:hypothetical protein